MFKTLKYILFASMGLLMWSCSSDYVLPHNSVEKGAFIKFDEERNQNVDVTDDGSAFDATVSDPHGNVTSYDLFASLVTSDSTYAPVKMKTITSFPADVVITVGEVKSAFGFFEAGNEVQITAEATRDDGAVFKTENLSGDLLNPGQAQAMSFSFFGLCPWVQADAVGQYLIVNDGFAGSLDPTALIECVAGPGDNEVTFIDLMRHPEAYDVTVSVDAVSDVVTIAQQPGWNSENFGLPYGPGTLDGEGLFFSCSGLMTVNVNWRVAAGSFGNFPLALQKQ